MLSNLQSHICSYCHKIYVSDNSLLPASINLDGSIRSQYDSSKFCSKSCATHRNKKSKELHKCLICGSLTSIYNKTYSYKCSVLYRIQ